MVGLPEGRPNNAPQGLYENSPAIDRWEQDEAPLLLLAGFAREEEEGGTIPSNRPLKRWAILALPSGTK